MGDSALIEYFLRNAELFKTNNIIIGAIKEIGWFFFKIMVMITDACEKLYDVTFGLVDISTLPKVNTFIENFKPLFIGLMAVSLFALGIMLMFNHEKKPKILINICVAILCVTCSTLVFSQFNQIVKDLKTGIDTVAEESGTSADVYSMVSTHFFDLYYIDQQIGLSNIDYGDYGEDLPHPKLNKQMLNVIDYTEVLDPDDDAYDFKDNDAEDILSQSIAPDGDGKNYTLKDNYNGFAWTSIGNKFYYRYQMDFIPVILQLIALFFLYIALSYKCTRIAFELVFARLLAYLYSAELSGGQKISKILTFIRDSYILLLITTVCLKIYYMLTAYVEDVVDNPLVAAIIGVFIAFSVIDGPNLVEKLLGMDAGLQSSTSRVVSAFKVGGWLERKAEGGVKMAGRTAGKGFGYARDKMKDHKEKGNGMQQAQPNGTDTSFMDDKDKAKGSQNSKNADGTNNAQNKEKDTGGNGKAGAAAMGAAAGAAGMNAMKDAESSKELHSRDSDFASTAFMDEEKSEKNHMDEPRKDEGIHTDFMDEEKPKDEHRFMDDGLEHTSAADTPFMDEPHHTDDTAETHEINDSEATSVMKDNEGNQISETADKAMKTHEEKDKSKPNDERGHVSGTSASHKTEDRWDKMMKDRDVKNRESSFKQKSPKYKGDLMHRNFNDEDKKGEK